MGGALRRLVEPDDVVAETWLVALPKLRDLDPGAGRLTPRLLAFLSRTGVHIVNRQLEKLARRERIAPPAPAASEGGGRGPLEQVSADMSGVVSRAMRDEEQRALERCLDELRDCDREVLILRGIEGLPNDDVADRLGVAPNTAAQRYRRALARLRDHVRDLGLLDGS